jgi:hypothetical protein
LTGQSWGSRISHWYFPRLQNLQPVIPGLNDLTLAFPDTAVHHTCLQLPPRSSWSAFPCTWNIQILALTPNYSQLLQSLLGPQGGHITFCRWCQSQLNWKNKINTVKTVWVVTTNVK